MFELLKVQVGRKHNKVRTTWPDYLSPPTHPDPTGGRRLRMREGSSGSVCGGAVGVYASGVVTKPEFGKATRPIVAVARGFAARNYR
jgi:hypothetical protein